MGLWDQFLDWLQQLTEFLLGFFRPKPTLTLDEEIPVEASYGKTFCYSCDWPILNQSLVNRWNLIDWQWHNFESSLVGCFTAFLEESVIGEEILDDIKDEDELQCDFEDLNEKPILNLNEVKVNLINEKTRYDT